MTDYVTFEAFVVAMPWGKATYTVIRIPSDIAASLENAGAKRVEGEINEHPVNLAISKAPVFEGLFFWAGKSLLNRLSVYPGQQLEIRIRPAQNDRVDLPDDVAFELRMQGVLDRWEALTPGKRRGFLYKIDTARTGSTRSKRLSELVASLAE
jgi:Bacteriocin-protection, YdeI or OmpD-Associated/Domain of unknown function (DUF1905)